MKKRLKYVGLRLAQVLVLTGALLCACGTNTEEPVLPVYLIFSSVAAPALVSVTAVETQQVGEPLRYEFDVRYFVTNSEDGFLGYNLYVDSSQTSAEAAILGITGAPYLPNGVAPSFNHSAEEASTASTDLQTQRVNDFKAAPAPESFQSCELYFFRITAVTRNGIQSNPSPQLQQCAALNAALCPSGSPCNP
jgi:hypothetical protein